MLQYSTNSFYLTLIFLFFSFWARAQNSNCIPPTDVTFDVTENSIDFSWSMNDTIDATNFRYRVLGDIEWQTAMDVGTAFSIQETNLCVTYEFQLQNVCFGENGVWSDSELAASYGCCENPAEINSVILDEESILFSWPMVDFALSYNFRIRVINTQDWTEFNLSETEILFTDFITCSTYEYQIQTVCESESEPFSESQIITTPTCTDPCTSLPYCEVTGYNSDGQHIGLVQLNTIDNTSGSNNGYGDFTGEISTDLVPGASYEMTLEPIYTGNFLPESFGVWIDFNQNGIFEISEKVLARDTIFSIFSQTIIMPSSALFGSTRMRIAMQHSIPPNACNDETFMFDGEAEDYCVNFVCPLFLIQDTTFTSTSEIGLEFQSSSFVDENFLSFRQVGETEWQEFSIDQAEIVVDGLNDCSEYEFRTRTQCRNTFTEYTDPVVYSTRCVSSVESTTLQSVNIYPNPFDDNIMIDLGELKGEIVTYKILNHFGAEVKSGGFRNTVNPQINMQGFAHGIYYFQMISTEGNTYFKKLIKM